MGSSYARLIPYLWPHRRALAVSTLFGCFVAILWSVNLSVAFPVVKVLLEGEDLHTYVASEIARADAESEDWASKQVRYSREVEQLEERGISADAPDLEDAIGNMVRAEGKRTEADERAWQMRWVEHHILPWLPHDKFQTFTLILGLLLVATVLKGVFIFFQDVLVGRVVQIVLMAVRKEMLRKTLRLDYPTLMSHGVPQLMSRFTFDTEQMSLGLNMISGRLVREPLKCLACLIGALWINWRLTLLSMLFAPLMGLFFLRYGKLVKSASRRMTESMSRLYRILEETLEGLKVVLAFGTASKHRTDFHREYKEYLNKAVGLVRVDSIAKPTSEVLVMLALFVALLPAAYLVLAHTEDIWGIRLASDRPDLASLACLYAMLAGMLDPCRKMSNVYSRLKRSGVSIDRVFELIDQTPAIRDPESPVPLPRVSRSIEFENVSFTYPATTAGGHRGPVLRQLGLRIDAGEVVAIVGPNGCGKSTLVNLLPRFYDVDSGCIRLDGVPINAVKLEDLRQQIGLVTQDTVLFDGTVYENILYGARHATEQEVLTAADRAYVTPILDVLPHGIHSRVGERGKELSGGQRQRLALARAMVRNPSILILDEATSAIDNESASLIHRALKEYCVDRTVLLITHSMTPSLLEFVTRIVVIDDGQVLANGTHEQLLQGCVVYRRLFHATREERAAA
ncbi:MAG: ABC transporter ATP-binding protein [Planctomycetaceae bacterium]|nr:ABC transporter ATP-binding protein [Planctomycetaceae bacterium]